MTRTSSFVLVSVVCGAALLAAACGVLPGNGGTKVTIPDSYKTSDKSYTLLYSTLGYEANASKRVLIRQNDATATVSNGLAFEWHLVDANGKQAAAGHAPYIGTAWSIPLWSADFSSVVAPGAYRLMAEAPDVKLATDPFPIDTFLMFNTVFPSIALDNADARVAPIELDNGFFDSNSRTGSAEAHAGFLVGLLEVYERRRTAMSDDQKKRTVAAIDRAFDYLLLLSDAGSGKFASQSPGRPYPSDSPSATAAGLRALAHYAALFQREEPERAQRAFRRARLAEGWLADNAPAADTPALRAAVSYDLYRFSSDNATLQRAADAVQELSSAYDLRTMNRESADSMPHFEAMYRMWHDIPVHADRAAWEETAKKVAAQYRDMIEKNPFRVVPTGVTDDSGSSAAAQWDEVTTLPPPGDGAGAVIGNDWFMARAIDAVYLSEMTDDKELEKAATASLEWITGLNPGVPTERVGFTGGGSPLEAASFLTGAGGRGVRTWSEWTWVRSEPMATIVNGFRRGFSFEDSDIASETSIRHDGIWLYASSVYEDYLNAGKRPLPASARIATKPLAGGGGARVGLARAVESGGVMQFQVTVVGPNSTPLPSSKVNVAWSGAALPDVPPEQAVRTTSCETDAAGSCTVTLAAGELPVQRPITVAVTNVEHPVFDYDLSSDVPEKTATFP